MMTKEEDRDFFPPPSRNIVHHRGWSTSYAGRRQSTIIASMLSIIIITILKFFSECSPNLILINTYMMRNSTGLSRFATQKYTYMHVPWIIKPPL
ncbi:hypothetical protein LX36DRAFT_434529 [Colletotrichum falcatum]|nr:hypothetical protein LX36DRAFT_434529 [Colletotrichum falcatum]